MQILPLADCMVIRLMAEVTVSLSCSSECLVVSLSCQCRDTVVTHSWHTRDKSWHTRDTIVTYSWYNHDSRLLVFFFRMLAQSYTPNIYTPTPIPLLYNPFTIVLHKRLSAYMFRAAHTPACWIGTERNKDFHPVMPQPIGTRIIGQIPRVCEFRIKRKEPIVL